MATTKTCCVIWCVSGAALGLVTSHGQAHAQIPGCTAMEVAVEDQFTQRWSPVVDKSRKENEPRGIGQQDATAPLAGVPLPRPRESPRQHALDGHTLGEFELPRSGGKNAIYFDDALECQFLTRFRDAMIGSVLLA